MTQKKKFVLGGFVFAGALVVALTAFAQTTCDLRYPYYATFFEACDWYWPVNPQDAAFSEAGFVFPNNTSWQTVRTYAGTDSYNLGADEDVFNLGSGVDVLALGGGNGIITFDEDGANPALPPDSGQNRDTNGYTDSGDFIKVENPDAEDGTAVMTVRSNNVRIDADGGDVVIALGN